MVPYSSEERPRTPWTLPISLFAGYRPETLPLETECFEQDWLKVRLPSLQASSSEDVKKRYWAMYPFLRRIYRRYSSLNFVGDKFSIGQNNIKEIMSNVLKMTDKRTLKQDDIDRIFI
jgi:hypothetical protein